MLEFAPGPSTVAVKFGASLTSRLIGCVESLMWTGALKDCPVSVHPLNPRIADKFVLVSRGSKVTSMLHEPSS